MEEDNWDKESRLAITAESNTLGHAYGAKMFATSVDNQDICQRVAETYECSDSQ